MIIFLSVDSRGVARNPLHVAFRAKSFTRNDIGIWICDNVGSITVNGGSDLLGRLASLLKA